MRPRLLLVCLTLLASACGGGSPAAPPPPTTTVPPPTTTLPPATLADLSASVSSPEAGRKINCRHDVNVVVTLTNRALTPTSASGVRRTSRITSGDCTPADAYTYRLGARVVGPGATETIMSQPIFDSGSGCCDDPKTCGGICGIADTYSVVTSAGSVPAGSISYRVEFGNCEKCSSSLSLAGACALPRR